MACTICNHAERNSIEDELLSFSFGVNNSDADDDNASSTGAQTLKDIAQHYDVSLRELQVHAVMHSRLRPTQTGVPEGLPESASIVDELKYREAQLLGDLIQEQTATMKMAGLKIRGHLANGSDGRTLSKEIVDTYLGTSNQIRGSIKDLFDMNQKLNGVEDSGTNALLTVVNAIRGSNQPDPQQTYTQYSGALTSEYATDDDHD